MNRNAKHNYRHNETAVNNGAEFRAKSFEKFEGKACITGFEGKARNPQNKKKGPRKGCPALPERVKRGK